METTYQLRFEFKWGGPCLWSQNEIAGKEFGPAIDLVELPLPKAIRLQGYFLTAWHDLFVGWDRVPEGSQWHGGKAVFNAAAQEFLILLREHLGPNYIIEDCSGTAEPFNQMPFLLRVLKTMLRGHHSRYALAYWLQSAPFLP